MTTVRGPRVMLGKGCLTLFLIIVIPRSRRRYPSVRQGPSAGRSQSENVTATKLTKLGYLDKKPWMSRPSRHSPGDMVFHVLNRGVGRRLLFTKDEDFLAFERVVEETLRTRRMRLCAYCLMPNHWHFVV